MPRSTMPIMTIMPTAIVKDFQFAWLNGDKTRLSVTYTGEVPTVIGPDNREVEDVGAVHWPTDKEVSKAVRKAVTFHGAGDTLLEAIYHAK